MSTNKTDRDIQTRRELFDFLQGQMQTSYRDLKEKLRFQYESNLIKSYIFEVNCPENVNIDEWLLAFFEKINNNRFYINIIPTSEENFYQLQIKLDNRILRLYIDAATDPRFWLAFSISESQPLDRWLETIVRKSINFDFVWLWPKFLERIQQKGAFRGFGLDYDYRKFEKGDLETTTYLKMQLWGGENTKRIYHLLRDDQEFRNKVVLSKVRFKEINSMNNDPNLFAIQDIKYNGKFTAKGTDLNTHVLTLTQVREQYKAQIHSIENEISLRWTESNHKGFTLEGFAIHFLPNNFELPVSLLVDKIFDGTEPFRLLGFPAFTSEKSSIMEVVDLHTGGKLSIELHPDMLTVYLPEETCGNTIARLYTNIQHTFNVDFRVETDHGIQLFN